jgi:hypothetical protein
MRRSLFALFALSVLFAALSPVPPAAAQQPAAERPEPERAIRAQWAAEVRDLRAREKADLAAHRERAALAYGTTGFAQAQRELEASKREWRLRVLDAQLRYSRLAGKTESASRIEERMRELRELGSKRTAPAAQGGGR